MRKILILGAICFLAPVGSAHAILMRCADGTVVGPLIPPNPCRGHGNYGQEIQEGGNGSQGQAGSQRHRVDCPVWGVANPGGCWADGPESSGSQTQGGQNQNNTPTRPYGSRQRDLAVAFALTDFQACVRDLASGAAAARGSAHIPDQKPLDEYCRRLFPSGMNSGTQHAKLRTTFTFQSFDECKLDLTTRIHAAHGTPELPSGQDAEEFCDSVYPLGSGGNGGGGQGEEDDDKADKDSSGSENHTLGGDAGSRGGFCTVQAWCWGCVVLPKPTCHQTNAFTGGCGCPSGTREEESSDSGVRPGESRVICYRCEK